MVTLGTQTDIEKKVKMSRKRRSEIWSFMEDAGDTAFCLICKCHFKYTEGSTSNLLKHLKAKHPTEFEGNSTKPEPEIPMEPVSTLEFIDIIKDFPALWKKMHPDFCNRDKRTQLTAEVAHLAGMSPSACSKKLKNLKDAMRAHVAKLPATISGLPDFSKTDRISWPYFKGLLFMKKEFYVSKIIASMDHNEQLQLDDTDEGSHILYENYLSTMSEELHQDQIDPNYSIMQTSRHSADDHDAMSSVSNHSSDSSLARHSKRRRMNSSLGNFSSTSSLQRKVEVTTTTDEFGIFGADIANDLRKIKCPLKLMQAKAHIRRVAEEFVLNELLPSSSRQSMNSVETSDINAPLLIECFPESDSKVFSHRS